MGEGGREVWVGLEWSENSNIRQPKVAVAAAFAARSGRVRRQLAVKFHGDGHLVVALFPGWRV